MKWFGESWGAPCCETNQHVPVPVGQLCPRCRVAMIADDHGLVIPLISDRGTRMQSWHLACFLDAVGIRTAVRRPEARRLQ